MRQIIAKGSSRATGFDQRIFPLTKIAQRCAWSLRGWRATYNRVMAQIPALETTEVPNMTAADFYAAFKQSRDERDRALEALSKEYPKTFFTNPKQRVPLKHGIERDIYADLVDNNGSELLHYDIDEAVKWYQSHVGYKQSCAVTGKGRVDLQGAIVARVTESEARTAKQEADAGFAAIEERRRQWRPQPPQSGPVAARPTASSILKIDTSKSNVEMLTTAEQQLGTVKNILGDTANDPLGREMARFALRHVIDELNAIITRIDGKVS